MDPTQSDSVSNLWEGIVVGGVGGVAATLSAALVFGIIKAIAAYNDKRKLFRWLTENASDRRPFRSTRALASWNNMTEDRVRHLCSIHKDIYLSTGEKPDLWGVKPRKEDNYSER